MSLTSPRDDAWLKSATYRSKRMPVDPSGRLQVIECADDSTGGRLFAVYDGLAVLRLCATHEQSLVFVHQLLTDLRYGGSPGESLS